MYKSSFLSFLFILSIAGLSSYGQKNSRQPVYTDKPFVQDFSIKFYSDHKLNVSQAYSDQNGIIQILSDKGLQHPHGGQFLYPGSIEPDRSYRFMATKKIAAIGTYQNQLVYLTDKVVLSNAWAGKLFSAHGLPSASLFAGGKDFTFLVSDKKSLQLIQDSKSLWKGSLPDDEVLEIRFQESNNRFWILGKKSLHTLSGPDYTLNKVLDGNECTAFDLNGEKAIIGTTDGYIEFNIASGKQVGEINKKLPSTRITAVKWIGQKVWFGTDKGAFALRSNGKFDYYNGERWLPGNNVVHISEGPGKSVLILTNAGLGQIVFKQMTLAEKAAFYEEQVRARHIRNGFNASLDDMEHGKLSSGYLSDSDNDGLWTSMYLGGEIFRYNVTKDPEALRNCRESLDAMERLYSINPVPGFPARSFERAVDMKQLHDPERWQPSPDKEWFWKSTTSSDEVIGHIFAFGAMAELVDDAGLKKRAITLMDTVMSHILKNDMYLIDFDGKPTMWGKWNPEYVNSFPVNVGDRKLNSSNIVAMLQTAYHFTKKEKYKKKALELMTKHGYLENMMRSMKIIGKAPEDADEHSKHMSDGWNHSDDEMYFLGYWGLYRYALNDTLKAKYKEQIIDHWTAERPEKEGAWNIFTALTGTPQFDLKEAVWYLQEHPMDLVDWNIENSHRKDIEMLEPNFRKQTTREVLPPDERPVQRHNGNMFNLDRKGKNGASEHSAGDIWLLPYWMGRYLGVISPPVSK
jgi:hypothetical protein